MVRHKKSLTRDPSQLSGKPLSQTVVSSPLNDNSTESVIIDGNHVSVDGDGDKWVTSPDLVYPDLPFTPDIMYNLITFLLGNPNMISSHLFRADILLDSAGLLKTPEERERLFAESLSLSSTGQTDAGTSLSLSPPSHQQVESVPAREIPGFELKRTVVRRLIPRNPNLDRVLDQTCHFYEGKIVSPSSKESLLFVHTPHVSSKEDLPYYHPLLRSLAFLYEFEQRSGDAMSPGPSSCPAEKRQTTTQQPERSGTGSLSLHFIPFSATESESFDPFPTRLERTLQILLPTHVRLARSTRPSSSSSSSSSTSSQQPSAATDKGESGESNDSYNPAKDNVIPRHLVQNTYSRLKLKYAADLCRDWVEETEPSKHVFEDLAITAFLIELWRSMYGVGPEEERRRRRGRRKEGDDGVTSADHDRTKCEEDTDDSFPGFVDVACGNGVLVYVLLMEGYQGWGFDARRRKTWAIFPPWVQNRLKESIYIPKPFADAVSDDSPSSSGVTIPGVETHTGSFPEDTFIISNHADELTVWTPLMAALANPDSPLPFLAIPCCSHSLSGAKYRYPPPKIKTNKKKVHEDSEEVPEDEPEQNPQPSSGDLKALRAAKLAASTKTAGAAGDHNSSDAVLNSMYGSLTAKTMTIASELGYEVEKTLLRIPSTRNMGVIGGRRRTTEKWAVRRQEQQQRQDKEKEKDQEANTGLVGDHPLYETALQIIHRECAREGGIDYAARIWIQRATGLHQGQGKGRVRGERSGGGGGGRGEGSGH